MQTRVLGLAVVAAALAATVNALAYKTAAVTNAISLSVVNTSAAALAFEAADSPDPGLSVSFGGSGSETMSISINEGIQRNAVYTFRPAFKIKNNSNASTGATGYPVALTYSQTGTCPSGVTLSLLVNGGSADLSTVTSLAAGNSTTVDLQVTTSASAAMNASNGCTLTITGTR